MTLFKSPCIRSHLNVSIRDWTRLLLSSLTNLRLSYTTRRNANTTASGLAAAQRSLHQDCEVDHDDGLWHGETSWPRRPHYAPRQTCHVGLLRGGSAQEDGDTDDEATDGEEASNCGRMPLLEACRRLFFGRTEPQLTPLSRPAVVPDLLTSLLEHSLVNGASPGNGPDLLPIENLWAVV